MTVNKSAGDLVLNDNVLVSGNLSVISGDLDMNGKTVKLGTNATLSETPGNTAKGAGQLVTTRDLNPPNGANVAGLGFEMTTNADLGSTQIVRKHDEQNISGKPSILRNFDVSSTNNSGLNASLFFIMVNQSLTSG